jgi:hypothetical protein
MVARTLLGAVPVVLLSMYLLRRAEHLPLLSLLVLLALVASFSYFFVFRALRLVFGATKLGSDGVHFTVQGRGSPSSHLRVQLPIEMRIELLRDPEGGWEIAPLYELRIVAVDGEFSALTGQSRERLEAVLAAWNAWMPASSPRRE